MKQCKYLKLENSNIELDIKRLIYKWKFLSVKYLETTHSNLSITEVFSHWRIYAFMYIEYWSIINIINQCLNLNFNCFCNTLRCALFYVNNVSRFSRYYHLLFAPIKVHWILFTIQEFETFRHRSNNSFVCNNGPVRSERNIFEWWGLYK